MNKLNLFFLFLLAGLLECAAVIAQPMYESPQTKEVVQKMVIAHGGLSTWRNAPTISFDNVMFNPFEMEGPDAYPWWVYHEVIDQKTRRVYQDWPIDNAQLIYDGNEVWSENWTNANTPRFMIHFFYYFVNLPWLTQDDNVRLGAVGQGRLPGHEKDYHTVTMSFTEKPAVGKTKKDSFTLYIDPDTFLLQGYEYMIGFGPMLDLMGVPEGEIFGPMLRVHDDFATVDGLVFPLRFHTMAADGSATYGYHMIMNHSITEPFVESRMMKTSGAVVDKSTALRASEK